MTKNELLSVVAEKTKLTKADVDAVLGVTFKTITSELKKGEKVKIADFGGFEVKNRAARKGKNPKTGAVIVIPASKRVTFKAAKALKDVL